MTTRKSVSTAMGKMPAKGPAKVSAKAPAKVAGAKAANGVVATATAPAPATKPVLPEFDRAVMVAEAAYYRAEKRGFVPGDELDDWFLAEAEIERLLRR